MSSVLYCFPKELHSSPDTKHYFIDIFLHPHTIVNDLLRRRHVLHPVVPRHIDLLAAIGRHTDADKGERLALLLSHGGSVVVPLAVLVLVLALVRIGVSDAAAYDGTGCQL